MKTKLAEVLIFGDEMQDFDFPKSKTIILILLNELVFARLWEVGLPVY